MTTFEFLSRLQNLDIKLWAEGDRLHCSAPKGVLTPALRAELATHKAEILTYLDSTLPSIFPVSRDGDLSLSFAHERLWFLDQLEPDSAVYNIPTALRITGCLDAAALEQSLNGIIRRHETLRTTFTAIDGRPVQVITPSLPFTLPVVDLGGLSETEREAKVLQLSTEEAERPFDLSQGPLFRGTLLRLGEEEHVLLLTMHHIISDGWSMGVLYRELSGFYDAYSTGSSSPLPELPIQYADFAQWQRQWLEEQELEKQLSYWEAHLTGLSILELPLDRPRPAVQTYRGARQSLIFSTTLTEALKELSRREEVTLFMTLLAAFQTLLHRYTGQDDIGVGSPIAGRNRAEIEGLIGFFVNTLVLRTDLSGNPSFRELLRRVREGALGAYANQDLPFEKLVEELQPERDLSRSPLFQVMFDLQNASLQDLELTGLTVSSLKVDNGTAKFDLSMSMVEEMEGLRGTLEYNTDLFDAATIMRLAGHFQTLLEGVVANPDQRLSDLPLLTKTERRQLLVEWNATEAEYPQDARLHDLFEAQVERIPDAIAVEFEDKYVTYRELNRRANQVAHFLQALGVGSDVLVGLCVERSLEMVVGLLGILKAGGAYVPLDPAYPPERLTFMLKDAGVPVLLTQARLSERLPEHRVHVVYLDTEWETIARESAENPASDATADNLAYVIYTSGSTGKPKGALVAHRGLCNLAKAQVQTFDLQPDNRILQFSSLSFDASIFEIIMALGVGATLCLGTQDSLRPGPALIQLLRDQAITNVTLPPSVLAALPPQELPLLRTVISAGEACSAEIVARWGANRRFFNAYGPTEATVWATVAECLDGSRRPSIGRPINNVQIYVLDPQLQPVPIGVPGELHIGGVGLARGYLNRPELTTEKFIPHPFSDALGAGLYKTGDLARYRPDGTIEFLGRIDHQVKIRGFRIELGEIEAVLTHHPAVREGIVLAREDVPGDPRLVAYVVLRQQPALSSSELRRFLQTQLPDYMVPATFIWLEHLPLTPNGKVDQRALPMPDSVRPELEKSFVAPRDALELQLTKLWEEALGIQPIGVGDNFFELGGHSLLAVRLFAQIEKISGKKLPLATLFQAPTVEQLADILRQEEWGPRWSSLVAIQPGGAKLPFFLVHAGEGNVLFYHDLAKYLGPDQPVYGLQVQGLDGQLPFHDRVEDMAAHYLSEIRTVQPEGPYLLGGWCFGCFVAFEMGQQLQTQGLPVALLALIDPVVPPALKSFRYRVRYCVNNLPHPVVFFRHVLGLSSRWTTRKTTKLLAKVFQRLQARYSLAAFDQLTQALVEAAPQVFPGRECISRARRRYVPQVYPERLTCFVDSERAPLSPYPWSELSAGGVEWLTVPGNHGIVFQEPHVQGLAEQLRACLEKAQAKQ